MRISFFFWGGGGRGERNKGGRGNFRVGGWGKRDKIEKSK